MRRLTLALALALSVARVDATNAAPPGPGAIVVLPFEPLDGAPPSSGVAASLKVLGALEGGAQPVYHLKQVNRALELHAKEIASLGAKEKASRLAGWVGASWIVSGKVAPARASASAGSNGGGSISIEITLADAIGRVAGVRAVEGRDVIEATSALVPVTLDLLGKVNAMKERPRAEPPPLTSKADALLEYAACYEVLIRQPIGIREPAVLDQKVIDAAIERCDRALKLDPSFADARAALGFAHAIKGDARAAEQHLAAVKDAQGFLPLYYLGKFWVLSRYYDRFLAVDFLRQAVIEHPGFLLARGYLGDACNVLGRHEEALDVFQQYLEAAPAQPWVMGRIGYTLSKLNRAAEAVEWTNKGLALTPSDSDLLLEHASRKIDAGHPDQAAAVLRRVISDGHDTGETHLRLGYALLVQNDLAEAEKELGRALELARAPGEWRTRGRARYDLAKLWMRRGDRDKAKHQLQLAIEQGFIDAISFERDKDLSPLAGDSRLALFIARARAENPALPQLVSPFPVDPATGEIRLAKSAVEEAVFGVIDRERRSSLAKQLNDSFDRVHGGFHSTDKSLDPAATELALVEAIRGAPGAAAMAQKTLLKSLSLIDPVWGGIAERSDGGKNPSAPWKAPVWRKPVWLQAEAMRLYALASGMWGASVYRSAALAIDSYIERFLTSPDGTFYAAQDAQVSPRAGGETYFKLADAQRRKVGLPRVDTTVITGDNARVIVALVTLWELTGDDKVLARAVRCADWLLANRRSFGTGFRRDGDMTSQASIPDTVLVGRALVALYAATGQKKWLDEAKDTIAALERTYKTKQGFNVALVASGGERPSVEAEIEGNAGIARFASMLWQAGREEAHAEIAKHALRHAASLAAPRSMRVASELLLADGEVTGASLSSMVIGTRRASAESQLLRAQRF